MSLITLFTSATDDENTASATLTININDVNDEKPTFTPDTYAVTNLKDNAAVGKYF